VRCRQRRTFITQDHRDDRRWVPRSDARNVLTQSLLKSDTFFRLHNLDCGKCCGRIGGAGGSGEDVRAGSVDEKIDEEARAGNESAKRPKSL
jgi:hypothetical protein